MIDRNFAFALKLNLEKTVLLVKVSNNKEYTSDAWKMQSKLILKKRSEFTIQYDESTFNIWWKKKVWKYIKFYETLLKGNE